MLAGAASRRSGSGGEGLGCFRWTEVSENLQAPDSKLQRNSKFQTPSSTGWCRGTIRFSFRRRSIFILQNPWPRIAHLVLGGFCNLPLGAFLVFGAFDLELRAANFVEANFSLAVEPVELSLINPSCQSRRFRVSLCTSDMKKVASIRSRTALNSRRRSTGKSLGRAFSSI